MEYKRFGAYFYPQIDLIRAPQAYINAFTKGLEKYELYNCIPKHWWSYPIVNEWKINELPPIPPIEL